MASLAPPPHQPTMSTLRGMGSGRTLYERRQPSTSGPVELVPNPDFVFPARDADQPSPDLVRVGHSSLPAQLASNQARSPPGPGRKSASALPQFSFNPSEPSGSSNSPPPASPLPSPTHSLRQTSGHRRGGSEFIGGDSRSSGVHLVSTSPTKDAFLPPPQPSLGPPKGRRGHAHRRSAAMSSHDLSSILQPPPGPRAESAPVTPIDPQRLPSPPPMDKIMSCASPPSAAADSPSEEAPSPSGSTESSSRPSSSRTRVGFSDKVEYIRPLSTISSETESTMSTVRGGHSVSNSISSMMSIQTGSPSPRFPAPIHAKMEDESRPSTAGAILDGLALGARSENESSPQRPRSSGSPLDVKWMESPKKMAFLKPDGNELGSSPRLSPDAPPRPSTSDRPDSDTTKVKASKVEKKPRKVRSWANSFMSRKPKPQEKIKAAPRPPTPTPPAPRVESNCAPTTGAPSDAEFFANFDIDDTVTIVSDDATPVQERPTFTNWAPRQLTRHDSDGLSPEIDLDAALGPLNNRSVHSPRSHGRGFSEARRKMHSSGFGGFGSNLALHRRAESAPELVPFDLSLAPKTNAGTMADVFEEDEEAAEREFANSGAVSITSIPEEPAEEEAATGVDVPGIGIQVVEADDSTTGMEMRWSFETSPRTSHDRGLSNITEERSIISREQTPTPTPIPVVTKEPATPPKSDSVDIVEDYEEPRTTQQATPTPPVSQKESNRPLRISLPLPHHSLMTPDSSTTSSFPSPDFSRGQSSFDTPRLGTAASSLNEPRPYHSVASFGELCPDVRMSVDDVPSLTSSRSTMTSALQNTFPGLRPRAPGERTSSLSSVRSAENHRRRKRSSIASLSKLMSGSFAEKSKLYIEHRPQSEHLMESAAEKAKTRKSRRLGKMMQFWKHRESKGSLKG